MSVQMHVKINSLKRFKTATKYTIKVNFNRKHFTNITYISMVAHMCENIPYTVNHLCWSTESHSRYKWWPVWATQFTLMTNSSNLDRAFELAINRQNDNLNPRTFKSLPGWSSINTQLFSCDIIEHTRLLFCFHWDTITQKPLQVQKYVT